MSFTDNTPNTPKELDQINITIASPKDIVSWSSGEVKNSITHEKDGLFCESIFGPLYKKVCKCGLLNSPNHNIKTCYLCNSAFSIALVRHERMGHIELAVPVTHIWFYCIGLMLNLTAHDMDRIIYYEDYILINPKGIAGLKRGQIVTEAEYENLIDDYGDEAPDVGMGAGALQRLLATIDIETLINKLRQDIDETNSTQNKLKISKRLKLAQGFRDSGTKPEWLILNILPVIPPDLRSLATFSIDRRKKKSLDELYRLVICSNNRLKQHNALRTSEVVKGVDMLILQQTVDAIFGNKQGSHHIRGAGNSPLRNLYNMLKGNSDSSCLNLLNKQMEALIDEISSEHTPKAPLQSLEKYIQKQKDRHEKQKDGLIEKFTSQLCDSLLGEKISQAILNSGTNEVIIPSNRKITKTLIRKLFNQCDSVEMNSNPMSHCINEVLKRYKIAVDALNNEYQHESPPIPQLLHDEKQQRDEQRIQAYKKFVQIYSTGESNTLNPIQLLIKGIQGLGLNTTPFNHLDHSNNTLTKDNFFCLLAEIELMGDELLYEDLNKCTTKSRSAQVRELIDAIQNNEIHYIKTILKDNSLVNSCDENGTSALHIAVECEHYDIVKYLCSIPCLNIEARTKNGDTALHLAARNDSYRIADKLCNYHANKKAINNEGQTPRVIAILRNKSPKLEYLLSYSYINFPISPIFHKTILNHNLKKSAQLLNNGLLINKIDANGETALHYIAKQSIFSEKLKKSAQWLITNGIDLNIANYLDEDTALHIACSKSNEELAQLLISNGANPEATNFLKYTPFRIAHENKNTSLLKILKESPIHKSFRLITEIKNNNYENVNFLIQDGANVNFINSQGNSPLFEAILHGSEQIVKSLISANAELNIQNQYGNTPLHVAIICQKRNIAKLLYTAGADPYIVNIKGETAINLASINENINLNYLFTPQIDENHGITKPNLSLIAPNHNDIAEVSNIEKIDYQLDSDLSSDSLNHHIFAHSTSTSAEKKANQQNEIFNYVTDDYGKTRISKYNHSHEHRIIKIPDFVYGFTLNEAPEAAIFDDLSGIEHIELGTGLRDLSYMFYRSGRADLDLSLWDVAQITNMSGLFCNSQLSHAGNLGKWNVSSVTDFSWLFHKSKLTHIGELDLWRMSQAKNLSGMFSNSQLTRVGNLSKWDVSQVRDMSWLFADTQITELGDLSEWDVSCVTDMQSLFEASQLKDVGDISKWNVSKVIEIRNLFSNVKLRKDYYPIRWVSQIRSIIQPEMFHLKNGHIFDFIVDKEGKIRIERYYDNEKRTEIRIPDFVHGFSCRKSYSVEKEIPLIKRYPIFDDFANLKLITLHPQLKDLSFMFYRSGAGEIDLSGWDVSKITSMESLFEKSSLSSIGKLDSWEVDQVVNMANLFASSTFSDVGDLSEWDITSVTNMSGIFKNSRITNAGYLGEWGITTWVTDKSGALENTQLENVGELKQHWGCFDDSIVNSIYDETLYVAPKLPLSNPPPPTQTLANLYSKLKEIAQYSNDSSYLLTACQQNSLDMVIWLMEKGAPINYEEALTQAQNNIDGRIHVFLQHIASIYQHRTEDSATIHYRDIDDLQLKRRQRSDIGQIHSLSPLFKICIQHSSSNCTIFLDIPKQKFAKRAENREICAIVSGESSKDQEISLEMHERANYYYSKEIKSKININTIFDNYKITFNGECRYFLEKLPFFMFREDDKGNLIQISKPTFSQGFYVLTDNKDLKTNGVCIEENTLTNRENPILSLRLFWVNPNVGDFFTINNIRYSLNDDLRATPEFTFPDKCTIFDPKGKPIYASTQHPNIEIVLPKNESRESFILCNETKILLEISDAIQFDEMSFESDNYLIKVNLGLLIPREAKLYKIQIVGYQGVEYLNMNYILLPQFTCDGVSELYYDKNEASVAISSDFSLKAQDKDIKVQNNNNDFVFLIPLSEDKSHRDLYFTVEDQQYTLRLKLHLLTLKYQRNHVHYSTKKDIWYRDLQSQLRVNIPSAYKISLYLESSGVGKRKLIPRVRGRKSLLDFRMDEVNQMIEESNKSYHDLIIKVKQNDSQTEYKYRILRKLWFHEFTLYSNGKHVFIRSKFDGKAECMVKFYHRHSNECICSASIESGKDSQIAGIHGSNLYDKEGNCRYDISISQKYKKGLSSKEEEIHVRYTPKINDKTALNNQL